jgi:hypothetical protein
MIASKKREQPPQLRIEQDLWDEMNGEFDQQIQIRMQPVLMYNNVPVQVLDTRSLSPMLPELGQQMGGFTLSPGDQMFGASPQSPGDAFSFGPPIFQFGGGPPPQKKMVPVKRRNSKPSPADRYMSQFLMKQNR